MRRALHSGALVRGASPDDQLADVLDRFRPALRPLSRCTTCGGELRPAAKEEVADLLEPGTRRSYDEFARCGACGKVYWPGAHAGRIDTLLRRSTRRGAQSSHPGSGRPPSREVVDRTVPRSDP